MNEKRHEEDQNGLPCSKANDSKPIGTTYSLMGGRSKASFPRSQRVHALKLLRPDLFSSAVQTGLLSLDTLDKCIYLATRIGPFSRLASFGVKTRGDLFAARISDCESRPRATQRRNEAMQNHHVDAGRSVS
jgi:hypothetical protein